jgi:hypothetical protein
LTRAWPSVFAAIAWYPVLCKLEFFSKTDNDRLKHKIEYEKLLIKKSSCCKKRFDWLARRAWLVPVVIVVVMGYIELGGLDHNYILFLSIEESC